MRASERCRIPLNSCGCGSEITSENTARRKQLVKLQARDAEAFVRKPRPDIRAVLLFGSDAGLIRERAKAVAVSVVADVQAPFPVPTIARKGLGLGKSVSARVTYGGGRTIKRYKLVPLVQLTSRT